MNAPRTMCATYNAVCWVLMSWRGLIAATSNTATSSRALSLSHILHTNMRVCGVSGCFYVSVCVYIWIFFWHHSGWFDWTNKFYIRCSVLLCFCLVGRRSMFVKSIHMRMCVCVCIVRIDIICWTRTRAVRLSVVTSMRELSYYWLLLECSSSSTTISNNKAGRWLLMLCVCVFGSMHARMVCAYECEWMYICSLFYLPYDLGAWIQANCKHTHTNTNIQTVVRSWV